MSWITLNYQGWPKQLQFTIGLKQSKDGPNASGDVSVFMQKGNDRQSRTAVEFSGQPLVANVQNGRWQSQANDYSEFLDQGYDTMVLEHAGREIVRQLLPDNQKQNQQGQPAGNARQTDQNRGYAIEIVNIRKELHANGKDCEITLNVFVTNNRQPATNCQLDFYKEGNIEEACQLSPGCKTDDNGRCRYTFVVPASGKRMQFEVQVRGGVRKAVDIELPAAAGQKTDDSKATVLEALVSSGVKDGNAVRYTVYVSLRDNKGRQVPTNEITWECSEGQQGRTPCPTGMTPIVISLNKSGEHSFMAYAFVERLSLKEPLKLKGPESAQSASTADDIQVNAAFVPNAAGMFTVTVRLYSNKKPCKGKFCIESQDELVYETCDHSRRETGYVFIDVETGQNGVLSFLLGFAHDGQVSVMFSISGKSVSIPLTKKRLTRSRE